MTLIFAIVVGKNVKSLMHEASTLKSTGKYDDVEKEIYDKAQGICRYAGVKTPVIRVKESRFIHSVTEYLGFPYFRNVLIVTDGAFNALKDKEGELEALLAHEIGHQKKHTFTRGLLLVLSDYTLFGNGFLALLQNSYKIEREADAFAVEWLERKLKSREKAVEIFGSLLLRQIMHDHIIQAEPQLSSDTLQFGSLKDARVRKELLVLYANASRFKKIWFSLRTLFQMYFGTDIISYFHPPYDLRKEWIKA